MLTELEVRVSTSILDLKDVGLSPSCEPNVCAHQHVLSEEKHREETGKYSCTRRWTCKLSRVIC